MSPQIQFKLKSAQIYRMAVAVLVACGAATGPLGGQAWALDQGSRGVEVGLGTSESETVVEIESPAPGVGVEVAASPKPLSFKSWKDAQLVSAQNQFARTTNRLVLFKAGKIGLNELDLGDLVILRQENLPRGAKAKEPNFGDVLAKLESDAARAKRGVEVAQELTMEEYVVGYLSGFKDNPTAMAGLVDSLSKEEMAELLKIMATANSNQKPPGNRQSAL